MDLVYLSRADVEDLGAICDQPLRMRDRRVRVHPDESLEYCVANRSRRLLAQPVQQGRP